MLRLLTKDYELQATSRRFIPIDVAMVMPDYYLYLYNAGDYGYVIVETDYLSGLPGIAKDAEKAFNVKALGWCIRKSRQTKDKKILPPDSDDYDPDGTNDENYNNYHDTVSAIEGWRYAVLKVELL